MKLLIALLAATGLAGCVAYPAGYYGNGYYGSGYASGYNGQGYYGGAVIETRPNYYGGYRYRDRDRDGVPNWRDRAPNNPYRY
jgi:hypothetical protein